METQRIIITGGATRIGAAIAEKLSGPNKQIIIHYNKSKVKAENLKKRLQNNGYAKTPIKQDISPTTFIILIFSLKKILEIKIINIGDDVYIIPILVTVVVWPAKKGKAPQIPQPVAPKKKSFLYSFFIVL